MKKLITLFYYFLYFNTCNSSFYLKEVLEKENSPIAESLMQQAMVPSDKREATVRTSTPPPLASSTDPQSPGFLYSPIRKERAALRELLGYLHTNIPTRNHPEQGKSPINPSKVVGLALAHIRVGPDEHFSSHTIFQQRLGKQEQVILQTAIDSEKTDKKGRTNLERMRKGRAPLGPDGKSINLHHISQEDGLLAEITKSTHNKHHNILHFRLGQGTSTIDRKEFNSLRPAYWRHRAAPISPQDPDETASTTEGEEISSTEEEDDEEEEPLPEGSTPPRKVFRSKSVHDYSNKENIN